MTEPIIIKLPISIDLARATRVCRFCGEPDAPRQLDGKLDPFVLNYGEEYAHESCLLAAKKENETAQPPDLRSADERRRLRALRAARDASPNHVSTWETCPRCLYTATAEEIFLPALDLIEELMQERIDAMARLDRLAKSVMQCVLEKVEKFNSPLKEYQDD